LGQVVALMLDRIREMMCRVTLHHAEAHGHG
jgi:hypothetical protein